MADQNATPQNEPSKETILQHVHDELEQVILAIQTAGHSGLERLRALKERVAKHL